MCTYYQCIWTLVFFFWHSKQATRVTVLLPRARACCAAAVAGDKSGATVADAGSSRFVSCFVLVDVAGAAFVELLGLADVAAAGRIGRGLCGIMVVLMQELVGG